MNLLRPFVAAGFLATTLFASEPNTWKFQSAPQLGLPVPLVDTGTVGTLAAPSNEATEASPPPGGGFFMMSVGGNVADEVTPEIQNLAASLQNDPARIFEFVYNAIEYEHYYGSKKGAHLTLLEASGNDMDQAALLVALYRAAGFTASYVSRLELIPYDNTVAPYDTETGPVYTGVNWFGLAADPFPGFSINPLDKPAPTWSDLEYKKSALLFDYFYKAGFRAYFHADYPGAILAPRTIVKLTVEESSYLQDPSAKHLTDKAPVDFIAATGFDSTAKTSFLTALGGTDTGNYVTGITSSAIQTELASRTSTFNAYIRTNRHSDSVRDVLGHRENQMREFDALEGWSYLYALPGDEADEIAETLMSKLSIQIDTNTAHEILMPALQGKRLSVTADGNTVRVWLDDAQLHTETVTAETYSLKMMAQHPHEDYLASGPPFPAMNVGETSNTYKKTGSYALIYAFKPSKRFLQSRQRQLDQYIDDVRTLNPALVGENGSIDLPNLTDAGLKRQVTTELLNVMGLNWLYQTEQVNQIVASVNRLNAPMLHRFGRMGQEEGFYVDVGLQLSGAYPKNGVSNDLAAYVLTFGNLFSALEHGLIDQYNLNANTAVSTTQILHLANASTDANKNRIYRATSANWSTVQTELIGYSPTQLSQFSAKVAGGSLLLLPRHANNGDSGWTWSGSGYIEYRNDSSGMIVGMIITGDYAGGYSVVNTFIDPAPVFSNYVSAPNYFDTGGVSNVINRTTPAYNVPSFFGADPVDMATGAMVFNKEDLSVGSAGVRGLSFQRHYNSNRRNSDATKLGHGWTHNYDMKAVVRTAAEAGLGETTPYEAAQMIAAAVMVNELIKTTSSAKQMVAGSLVAKVAVDNLLNNAVSLTMGKDTVQFIKQPDGTYTAPAGSTMSLAKSGDFYLATERFGNTYKFDTTAEGRIVEIKDFFNKAMTFSYTSGDLITVTDAYSRTLTLGYASGRISGVTASAGGSVSFAYTSGNLTGVTDPEGKTATFIYNSDRQLTELKDPENRTIVVNRYDSEGRVYEQDSHGESTKTWKLSFTGLRNTETDPLGGEKVYFYDKRGRPTGVQDALGNRTLMVYDGHDHMIERHTAKGEVYKQVFNADHDVVEAENPAATKTIYAYDSLKRVETVSVQDTDPLTAHRVTAMEYTSGNVSNLPNKITDPKGNITRRTYHGDGNLNTSVEESSTGNRTTTFVYDARGMPQKTTYHDAEFAEFSYGVRGNLDSSKDRRGNTTSFLYNARRQLTTTTQPGSIETTQAYDDSGNLQSITDGEGHVTRFTYSATGKLLTQTTGYGSANAETTTHVYDERDWKDYTLNPLSQKTDFGYDAAGRVVSIKNPLLKETTFEYDENGQQTLVRTPLGHETQYTYTALGAQETMTDPASNVVTYGYDGFGERRTLQNRRSNTFEFAYDANGNPTVTTTPLEYSITTVWNDRNLVGSVARESGNTTAYIYDDMRRVDSQTDPVGTVSFAYDENGNPETITEGTAVLTREWDALNRPESYTNARSEAIGYQFLDNGLLWKVTYPGSRVVTYTYYANNRLHTVTDWASRVTTYVWDDAGRLDTVTLPNNVTRTQVYDGAGRLERIYERNGAGDLLAYFKYGYDDDGRLTSRYRLPAAPALALPASLAAYDADNRVQTWGGQTVTHDDDGNMTEGPLFSAGMADYVFDARNRLTSVGTVAAGYTTYGYDAENNRVSMTDATGTTRYLIDPHGGPLPRVLVREKPDASTTSYVHGLGMLYEVDDATGEATYYHYDNIGNTIALTDAAGVVTDRVDYSPYGQVVWRTGTTDTPFLFVGQLGVQQDANGLLYMRARYYSPELMRFVNADPIGFAGGMNWYAYATGNPVMYVDASGHIPIPLITGGIGAVVGGAVGGIYAAFTGGNVRNAIVGGAVGGFITGSGAGLIGAAVSAGTISTAGALGAGAVFGAGGGVASNTIEQRMQGRSWSEISLTQQAVAGGAGAFGGLAGSGAIVANQFAQNSAAAMNATLQGNLTNYSTQLIGEGASDSIVLQVQRAVMEGMTRTGSSTAAFTSGVSAFESSVLPFSEKAFEGAANSWLSSSAGGGRK